MPVPAPPASRGAPVAANVIVVHPQPELRAQWAQTISNCNVWQAADGPAAASLAQEQNAQLLIAPWPWAAVLVRRRRRLPSCPLLLVGGTLDQTIVNAVAQGAQVIHLENEAQLASKAAELLQGDKTRAQRHRFDDLRVEWRGGRAVAQVADVSIDGFSFSLPAGSNIEQCLAGSKLPNVKISRGETMVVGVDSVTVRYLSGDKNGYRVGCSFDQPPATRHGEDGAAPPIRDPLQVAGVLQAALGQKLLRLQRPDHSLLVECSGSVDIGAGRVALESAAAPALAMLDVVLGSFEVGGTLFEFTSAVTGIEPLQVKLPAELRQRQRRGNTRHVISTPLTASVMGLVDLKDRAFGKVKDLSTTGCSLEMMGEPLLPRGTQLSEIRLNFITGPVFFAGVVTRATRQNGVLRVGIEFRVLTEEARLVLTQWLVSQRWPTLENGARASFDELFDLFVRSGLIKPAHIEALTPGMPEIQKTFQSLRKVGSSLFRSIVIHEKGKVVGHVSSVRAYQNTWYVQHLAAASGSPESALHVNLGVADFFDQLRELEYFKMGFYSENNWTGRAFGAFARRIESPSLSMTRKFIPLLIRVETTAKPAVLPAGVRCTEVTERDLDQLQYIFVQQQASLALKADDLVSSAFELRNLNADFGKYGLHRRRRAWVVQNDNGVLAVALGEFSSPGLSLFDYLNAIRILYVDAGTVLSKEQIIRLFMSTLIPHFVELGVPAVRLFIDPSEMPDYEKLGFAPARVLTEWTCHRRANRQLSEHIYGMGEALRERMKRMAPALASGRQREAPAAAESDMTVSRVNQPIPNAEE